LFVILVLGGLLLIVCAGIAVSFFLLEQLARTVAGK
jgi:hypothetical protein